MENALLEALAREFGPRPPHLRNAKGWGVAEKGYQGERIVFRGSHADCERIAAQHGARRVVEV